MMNDDPTNAALVDGRVGADCRPDTASQSEPGRDDLILGEVNNRCARTIQAQFAQKRRE
jgi:hypothetical protein